mmetsp:Transcript_29762/g.86719  ORF Transcript_29762/g.86719 Transcript_29762/m.86719 type:complete len:240 (+) Transcript_29762:713-1432(+)
MPMGGGPRGGPPEGGIMPMGWRIIGALGASVPPPGGPRVPEPPVELEDEDDDAAAAATAASESDEGAKEGGTADAPADPPGAPEGAPEGGCGGGGRPLEGGGMAGVPAGPLSAPQAMDSCWVAWTDAEWPSQMTLRPSCCMPVVCLARSRLRSSSSSSADPKMSPRCLAKDRRDDAICSPAARASSAVFSWRRFCSSRHLGSMSWMRMCSDISLMGTWRPVMGSTMVLGTATPRATSGW